MIKYSWDRKSGQDIILINMTVKNLMTRGEIGSNEAKSHSETQSFSFG